MTVAVASLARFVIEADSRVNGTTVSPANAKLLSGMAKILSRENLDVPSSPAWLNLVRSHASVKSSIIPDTLRNGKANLLNLGNR